MDKLDKKREVETEEDSGYMSQEERPLKIPKTEKQARARAKSSDTEFRVVRNDGKPESLELLLAAKWIVRRRLVKMQHSYILRLIFDPYHETILAFKGGQPVGTCVFRTFKAQAFTEVVFLAVHGEHQFSGYGTLLMTEVKKHVKTMGVEFLVTYADNNAIPFFQKQEFVEASLDPEPWHDYIKHYNGATLMQCWVTPRFSPQARQELFRFINDRQQLFESKIIYPGLNFNPKSGPIPIHEIPGVREAPSFKTCPPKLRTWTSKEDREYDIFKSKLLKLLEMMKTHRKSKPFHRPVDAATVENYYKIIKNPMDLHTMTEKLRKNSYRTPQSFFSDMIQIFENARTFNEEATIYYEAAQECEKMFREEFAKVFPIK